MFWLVGEELFGQNKQRIGSFTLADIAFFFQIECTDIEGLGILSGENFITGRRGELVGSQPQLGDLFRADIVDDIRGIIAQLVHHLAQLSGIKARLEGFDQVPVFPFTLFSHDIQVFFADLDPCDLLVIEAHIQDLAIAQIPQFLRCAGNNRLRNHEGLAIFF